MKKVLWTTLFWLIVVIGFAGYVRFFDKGGSSSFISKYILADKSYSTEVECPVVEEGVNAIDKEITVDNSEVLEKLEELSSKVYTLSSMEAEKQTDEKMETELTEDDQNLENTEDSEVSESEEDSVANSPEKTLSDEEQYKAFKERQAAQNK